METDELVESRHFLSRIGAWPNPKRLDVEGWLDNFDEGGDTDLAKALLESHAHIDEAQIEYAVYSSVRALSARDEFGPAASRQEAWRAFLDDVTLSFPLGRAGDATASGYIFARIASRLGFPEGRILDTEHLIGALLKGPARNVIILDDMSGTGTQFTRDWNRNYVTPHGKSSLKALAESGQLQRVYFIPTVCTVTAMQKIQQECGVIVSPTYVLESDYHALDANSRLVPAAQRPRVAEFIEKYGSGASDKASTDEDGAAGFGGLGLAISFHHGCPNNTLPVLQWGEPTQSWSPLVRN